jgi:hypothetical protein
MTERDKIAAKHALQKRIEPKSEICPVSSKKKVEKKFLLQSRHTDEYWEKCFMHQLFPKDKNNWKTVKKYKTRKIAQIILDNRIKYWGDKKVYEYRIIEKDKK